MAALLLFWSSVLFGQKTELPPLPAETQAQMQAVLDCAVNTKNLFPGIAFAVARPGYQTWVGVAGLSDVANNTPLKPEMIFRIGSVTKTFTSELILRLIDNPTYASKITLDTTLVTLLPDTATTLSNYPVNKITVRMLLNHTSGIYDYTNDCTFQDKYKNFPEKSPYSFADLIAIANANASSSTGMGVFSYSNTNYLLLAQISEAITQKAYPDQMNALIHSSEVGLPSTNSPQSGEFRMPSPYTNGYINWCLHDKFSSCKYTGPAPNERSLRTNLDANYAWSAGDITSNGADLAKWIRLVGTGVLLKPTTFAAQLDGVPMGPGGPLYGLGIMIIYNMFGYNETIRGHEGEISGFEAFAGFVTSDGTSLVQLINFTQSPGNPRQPTFQKIMDILYGNKTTPCTPLP